MRGYNRPMFEFRPVFVIENVLVGCRRCRETWREQRSMLKDGCRINGPMYDYDYCDKCIKESETPTLNSHPESDEESY